MCSCYLKFKKLFGFLQRICENTEPSQSTFFVTSPADRFWRKDFLSQNLQKVMMNEHGLAIDLLLICMSCGAASVLAAFNSTVSAPPSTSFSDNNSTYHMDHVNFPKNRLKRYISQDDRLAILDYHNKVRGNVFPPASNMEYMVRKHINLNICFFSCQRC